MMKKFSYLLITCLCVSIVLVGCNNLEVSTDNSNIISTIPAGILYLSGSNRPTEIYSYSLEKKVSTQLTFTEGKIFDFTVSDNSQKIVYGIINSFEGTDYWFIDNFNNSPKFLFSCEEDICFDPEFLPRGESLLVSRATEKNYGNFETGAITWLYNFSTNQFDPFFESISYAGYQVKFSSDQEFIAYQQNVPNGIRIINSKGEEQLFIDKGQVEGAFVWAVNKNVLYFLTEDMMDELPITNLWSVDITTSELKQFALKLNSNAFITQIKPSSDQSRIMFGVKENPLLPSQMILIYELNTGEISNRLSNPSVSYGRISWSPDNNKVIFQQYEFKGAKSLPEIGYWDLKTNSINLLVKDAYLPIFLP